MSMLRAAILAIAITATPAASGQEAVSNLSTKGRPPHDNFAPPTAVDHVAQLVITPIGGPPRTEQVTLKRSGDWQRTDRRNAEGVQTQFADFANGVSILWSRRDDSTESVYASRDQPDAISADTHRRTPRNEKQTWASETCDVWAWTPVNAAPYKSTWLSCVTADGIEVWRGIERNGQVKEYLRVTHVERRRVERNEVAPPADLFEVSRWRKKSSSLTADADYAVTLTDGSATYNILRHGPWVLETSTRYAGRYSLSLKSLNVFISYYEDGNRRSLSMRHVSSPVQSDNYARIAGRDEIILGHTCNWFGLTGQGHGGDGECRHESGAALIRSVGSRGDEHTVRATRFSLDALSDADVTPPDLYVRLAE